jgi:hypothetical protein
MNGEKLFELQTLFAKQEKELLQSLATIRQEMAIINGVTSLFRLYINNYTKNPIYYAHLFDDDGKQTDVRISCKTTDKEKAELYAKEHRESSLKDYYDKKNKDDFYQLLSEYYTAKSDLFRKAKQKRNIREKHIKEYKAFIDNYFIPFLKRQNIIAFNKANNIEIIEEFQLYCQDEQQNDLHHSLSTKTINNNIQCAIARFYHQQSNGLYQTK